MPRRSPASAVRLDADLEAAAHEEAHVAVLELARRLAELGPGGDDLRLGVVVRAQALVAAQPLEAGLLPVGAVADRLLPAELLPLDLGELVVRARDDLLRAGHELEPARGEVVV